MFFHKLLYVNIVYSHKHLANLLNFGQNYEQKILSQCYFNLCLSFSHSVKQKINLSHIWRWIYAVMSWVRRWTLKCHQDILPLFEKQGFSQNDQDPGKGTRQDTLSQWGTLKASWAEQFPESTRETTCKTKFREPLASWQSGLWVQSTV